MHSGSYYNSPRVEEDPLPAPYEAKAVANFFLGKGRLTQMKLHKLVYFAHGWHLGLLGEPLLTERVQAWRYGPVVPSLWEEFKWFGAEPIDSFATRQVAGRARVPTVDPDDTNVRAILERVSKIYGPRTAVELSRLTHEADSPWTAVTGGRSHWGRIEIPDELLADHFQREAEQNRQAREGRNVD